MELIWIVTGILAGVAALCCLIGFAKFVYFMSEIGRAHV